MTEIIELIKENNRLLKEIIAILQPRQNQTDVNQFIQNIIANIITNRNGNR